MVEIQLSKNQVGDLPEPLLILFAICTTLLVAVHMLALLISTCILPNMEAISSLHTFRYYFIVLSFYSQLNFVHFLFSLVHESPHENLHMCIELAWGCSTVLGILLFMIEVIILCWIQFYNVMIAAAYVATAILLPFVVLFIMFAFMFYRKLVAHTYEVRKSGIQELELLKDRLDTGDVDAVNYKTSQQDSYANIV